MDPIKTIGKSLKGDELRDAIHIAIMPVILDNWCVPGNSVKFCYGSKERVKTCEPEDAVGVIDPFVSYRDCEAGSRVWMFLRPNTITGLRHEWTHPEVDAPIAPVANESETWLHLFADKWNFDYEDMISIGICGGHWITAHGVDLHGPHELGADLDQFWKHLSILTGKTFTDVHKESVGWSCSC